MEPISDRWLAYWLLVQLFHGHPKGNEFVNFRVIHNDTPKRKASGQEVKETFGIWSVNVPVKGLKDNFIKPGGVFDQLTVYNRDPQRPCNIYYGLNLRTQPRKNKKEDIRGFNAFYLDLDVNDKYTFEDRQLQITFWRTIGLGPSVVIASGRGLQAIWCLERIAPQAEGEAILKRMVLASETKGEGNVWDVTRIFRLPGFLNQKRWYKGDSPPCTIFWPSHDEIQASMTNKTLMPRFAPEVFESFPICGKDALKQLCDEASAIDGAFEENFRAICTAYHDNQRAAQAENRAQEIVQAQQPQANQLDQEAQQAGWEPKYTAVPVDINDIAWPRMYKAWMKNYCKVGFDGLTPQKIEGIKRVYNLDTISASELDAKVMYILVKNGYTKEAVLAFWQRPDLKLWREDKMQRSPDYFDKTYDSMLASVRSVMDKNDPTEQQKQASKMERVTSSGYETWYWSGAKGQCVVTADLVIKAIFRDMDAPNSASRDHYELEAKTYNAAAEQGFDIHRLVLQRGVFNSCAKFREVCESTMCLMSDKNSHLSRLLNFLLHNSINAPIHQFHSKMVYENNSFIFPRLKITAETIERTATFDLVKELKEKFPLFDLFVSEPPNRAEVVTMLREYWPDLLRVYLPRVVVGMLGTIAATAMRARLVVDKITETFHMPTLNVRGSPVSGKTETVRLLYRLIGTTQPQASSISIRSTIFSINRMLELTNFIPLLIDEFKEEEESKKQIAHIREVVRRTYSGEMILRGNADKSVSGMVARCNLIVAGEHELESEGNVAESTRVLAMTTDEFQPSKNIARFRRLDRAPLWNVGPLFYQFILQQDAVAAYNEFCALEIDTTARLGTAFGETKTRVGHNAAAIIWGCRLYDRFIKSLDPELPTICETHDLQEVLINYMIENVQRSGKTITVANGAEGQTFTASRDELLTFLETFSGIVQRQDKSLTELEDRHVFVYHIDEEKNELYLHFQRCYELYLERCNHLKMLAHPPTLLRNRMHGAVKREDPWALHSSKAIWHEKISYKVAIFKLSMLREMGIWHPKTEGSTDGGNGGNAQSFGSGIEPKNRITGAFDFGPN